MIKFGSTTSEIINNAYLLKKGDAEEKLKTGI